MYDCLQFYCYIVLFILTLPIFYTGNGNVYTNFRVRSLDKICYLVPKTGSKFQFEINKERRLNYAYN